MNGLIIMISHLDHHVLTTRARQACVDFYRDVPGMEVILFGADRTALKFGQQKINIHEYGREIEPKAHLPVPRSVDLCFIVRLPMAELLTHLRTHNVAIEEGPSRRIGACWSIESVYPRIM